MIKRPIKSVIFILSMILVSVFCGLGLTSCNMYDKYASRYLNSLADTLTLLINGDDAYTWNILSVSPEDSYGYVRESEPEWYSYSTPTQESVDAMAYLFEVFEEELDRINPKNLQGADLATFRKMKFILSSYSDKFNSPYALDFTLIDSDYISSQGGYVASFADCVEIYNFRDIDDVDDLLSIVKSAKAAFETYLVYAADRRAADYPLYDSTLRGMKEYLEEVLSQGSSFYLYAFTDKKIDSVTFLTEAQKAEYKAEYKEALNESFMKGAGILCAGLDAYMGSVPVTEISYFGAYGEVGRELYQWNFENKTGLENVDLYEIYTETFEARNEYLENMNRVVAEVDAVIESNKQLYDDFYAYMEGEKKILGLNTPEEMLSYLKTVSHGIVPALKSNPEIDFKYMDETVGKITNTSAYYLLSPMDESGSAEHITLNKYYIDNNPDDQILTTIAHEGYPGHLYAHVNAKENGMSFLTETMTCQAFSEGWAVYTQLELLDIISVLTDDRALALWCEFERNYILSSYMGMFIVDMNVNYFGMSVDDLSSSDEDREQAVKIIETFMESPSVYVSYGYGCYFMDELHSDVISALADGGGDYKEPEFNALLLSEGSGPTLVRAKEMARDYIASKR